MSQVNPTKIIATIFILNFIEFLQTGMITFAANPIMGETSTSPAEFSLMSATYACIVILMIATQHWMVERIGWRTYIQIGLLFFAAGALICSFSDSFMMLLAGRATMALGGASFMTSARLLTLLLPVGVMQFKGIQIFVISMTFGTSLAPWLSSKFISEGHWSGIFLLFILIALIAFILVTFSLPNSTSEKGKRATKLNLLPILIFIIGGSAFFYVFRGESYNFFNNTLLLFSIFAFSLITLSLFFSHLKRSSDRPLLHVKLVFEDNLYAIGTLLVTFVYIMIGANNYILPIMLQKGLVYTWNSVGVFNSLGLSASIISWFVYIFIMKKKPGLRKFCLIGAAAIFFYAYTLSHLTPQANLSNNIFPAFIANGIFTIFLMSPLSMVCFQTLRNNQLLFSHAFLIRNILAQVSLSLGITFGTVFMQWRTTLHFSQIGENFNTSSDAYNSFYQQLTRVFSQSMPQENAMQAALAQLQQMLIQQSTLLASIDYFHCLIFFSIIFAMIIYAQRQFK